MFIDDCAARLLARAAVIVGTCPWFAATVPLLLPAGGSVVVGVPEVGGP